MEIGAWWATVHGVTRVRHNLATKDLLSQETFTYQGDAASCSIKTKIVQTVFCDFMGTEMNRLTLYSKIFSSVCTEFLSSDFKSVVALCLPFCLILEYSH